MLWATLFSAIKYTFVSLNAQLKDLVCRLGCRALVKVVSARACIYLYLLDSNSGDIGLLNLHGVNCFVSLQFEYSCIHHSNSTCKHAKRFHFGSI